MLGSAPDECRQNAEPEGDGLVQLVRGDRDPASHHPQVQRFDDIHPEQIPA